MDDLIVWSDGTFCFQSELHEYHFMSDDYKIIQFGTEEYDETLKEFGYV